MDISLLVTIGGMLVSVVSAAAIAKNQIKNMMEHLEDAEGRIRSLDVRVNKLDATVDTLSNRVNVLVGMMSPDIVERRTREIERIKAEIDFIKQQLKNATDTVIATSLVSTPIWLQWVEQGLQLFMLVGGSILLAFRLWAMIKERKSKKDGT